MTDNIWDDPELQTNDDFIKLEKVGDKAEGVILSISRKQWDDGSVSPQILLRCPDGAERTYTAGQTQAKVKLVELRPKVGDYVRVELMQVEKRGGGKTLKHIEVEHRPGSGPVPAAASTSAETSRAKGSSAPPF